MHYEGFAVSSTSKGLYLRDSSPGLDKLPASVHDVLHLQVHGRGHDGHDVALPQIEPGRVHEVQEDAETLGVDLGIQVNHTQVTLQLVCEDAVEQATAAQTHASQEQTGPASITGSLKAQLLSPGLAPEFPCQLIITAIYGELTKCQRVIKHFTYIILCCSQPCKVDIIILPFTNGGTEIRS